MRKDIPFFQIGIIILLSIISDNLHSQNFHWVNFTPILSGYANGGSGTQAATHDNEGNVYTIATFNEAIVAGNDTVYPFYPGSDDLYLTKWNTNGEVIWIKPFGGSWYDGGRDLDYDAVNNRIYATCFIQGNTTQLTDTAYSNSGEYQMMIFDSSGNFISTRFLGWSNCEFAIRDSTVYYSQDWNTIRRTDLDGNIKWSLSPTSVNGYFFFTSVAITPQHDVLAAGIFANSFVIGNITVNAVSAPSGEASFLLRADSSGNVKFAKFVGSLDLTYYNPIPLAGDDEGNTYLSDRYSHSGLIFGNDTLPVISSVSGVFIAKFDTMGNSVWGRTICGNSDTYTLSMLNNNNELFVCGSYSGEMNFGTQTLPNSGYGLGYVAKMDINGNYLYAKEIGSYNGSSWCSEITAGPDDNYYIGGTTYGGGSNSVFGCFNQAFSNQFLTSFKDTVHIVPEVSISQVQDFLVADYNCDCSVQWYFNGNSVNDGTSDSLLVIANGSYYASVIDPNHCSAQSPAIDIIDASIPESENAELQVNPNPFSANLEITLQEDLLPASLKIYNILGQPCFASVNDFTPAEGQLRINTSTYTKGLYILEVNHNGRVIKKKIIKQ
jgi:hypothetical protein